MSYTLAGRYGPETFTGATTGRPLVGVAVTVYLPGTTTPASLFSDAGKTMTLANPVVTDGFGNLAFYAAPGTYDLLADGVTLTVAVGVNPAEPLVQTFQTRPGTVALTKTDVTGTGLAASDVGADASGAATAAQTAAIAAAATDATTKANNAQAAATAAAATDATTKANGAQAAAIAAAATDATTKANNAQAAATTAAATDATTKVAAEATARTSAITAATAAEVTRANASYVARDKTTLVDLVTDFGVTPGSDASSALQLAVTQLAAVGGACEIFHSKPGVYGMTGASQTGTAQGVNYAGQVLVPGFSHPGVPFSLRVRGCGPAAIGGGSGDLAGVVYQSNASSGYVFDVIPGFTNPSPYSNIDLRFDDMTILVNSADPQAGGINASRAARFYAQGLSVVSAQSNATALTGTTQCAVKYPGLNNFGLAGHRNVHYQGFPIAMSIGEHGTFSGYTGLYNCAKAVSVDGGGILNHFENLQVGGCPTVFYATTGGGGHLDGSVHIEPGGLTSTTVIDDSHNLLGGSLTVQVSGWAQAGGLPAIGGKFLALRGCPAPGSSQGANSAVSPGLWAGSTHPVDNFARIGTELTAAAIPGYTSDTYHPWRVQTGTFSRTTNSLKNNGSYAEAFVPAIRGGVSRVVEADITWNNNIQLFAQHILGGTNNDNAIMANAASTNVTLKVNGTTVGTAAGVLVAGTNYTLSLAVLLDAMGRPISAQVFLGGTSIIGATAIGTPSSLIGGNSWPYIEDGLGIVGSTDVVKAFRVRDYVGA